MPEKTCFGFIDKYSAERETLLGEIETLEENLKATESTKQTADDFITPSFLLPFGVTFWHREKPISTAKLLLVRYGLFYCKRNNLRWSLT